MHLHEYQSKQLLAEYGVPVPRGRAVVSPQEALQAADELGGEGWVVKAQVHAGGRGKAGGVVLAQGRETVAAESGRLLGSRLVTRQTGDAGLPVAKVLVEEITRPARELYLSALVDRATARIVFVASQAGGMDIEQVASDQPDKILSVSVDPVVGLQGYQCRLLGFGLGLGGTPLKELAAILRGLYRVVVDCDASLVEINPLVVTKAGGLLALDAKINLDDNALFRQARLAALRDVSQEDAAEAEARAHDLNYIRLHGTIGCMVNGAGLAMATMDLVKLHGGEPANFLDVGGGTTAERVAEAFKLILSDENVRAVLVNIFGGIVRCDLIAEGIIQAVREVELHVPVVVRLEGTNAQQGLTMLAASGLDIATASDLAEAAVKAIGASA